MATVAESQVYGIEVAPKRLEMSIANCAKWLPLGDGGLRYGGYGPPLGIFNVLDPGKTGSLPYPVGSSGDWERVVHAHRPQYWERVVHAHRPQYGRSEECGRECRKRLGEVYL